MCKKLKPHDNMYQELLSIFLALLKIKCFFYFFKIQLQYTKGYSGDPNNLVNVQLKHPTHTQKSPGTGRSPFLAMGLSFV